MTHESEMRARRLDLGPITLHLEEWPGAGRPFLLLHGLASNARTWRAVARHLAAAGHYVAAVDQRGHGLSDRPADGYDFASVTNDLHRLIERLQLDAPIVAGQSWGANVVLEFAARYPGVAAGLVFVDGGFLDLRSREGATWEAVEQELAPPQLEGLLRETLVGYLRSGHPDWDDEGIEGTLGNFESRPDGSVRPWLERRHHMAILRALWEQRPGDLFPQVTVPVLIAVAERGPAGAAGTSPALAAALEGLATVEVVRFDNTDHDIHVHRPSRLAALILDRLDQGFWSATAGSRQ